MALDSPLFLDWSIYPFWLYAKARAPAILPSEGKMPPTGMNPRRRSFSQRARTSFSRWLPALAVLGGLLAPAFGAGRVLAADPESIEGKWYGMAGFPQDRVELGLEIRRNEAKEQKAFLYQPVINFYGLELSGAITRDGDAYVIPDLGMSVTLQAGVLDGTFTSLKVPVSLTRTDRLPAEVPVPDLPKGPGPKWQSKLAGAIWSTAAVREGTAYVGTAGESFTR
jgi:hypothetical protein